MEEEKNGVDKGEVWQQGDLLVDVGLPPTQQIGQDEAEEVGMQAEDEAVAGYWGGRGSQDGREDSPERSPCRTPAHPPTPVTDFEEAEELEDDGMDGSDLEEAGGGGFSEDVKAAAKKRRKEVRDVAKLGKVRQAVFAKKA